MMTKIWKPRLHSYSNPLSFKRSVFGILVVITLVLQPEFARADSPKSSAVQAEQIIRLNEGWNSVAFNVVPDNLDLSEIFSSVLSDIELVKNGAGAIFSPEYGIDMISPIDLSQGYKVKARRAVDVSITGTPIDPAFSPLSLSAGWNLVPFFASKNLALTEAFSTIITHVVRIEDGAGRVYSADSTTDDLDSLMVGYSYSVYVDQPVTFSYPTDDPPPPPPPPTSNGELEVNTIFDAVALAGLQVGDTLTVLGYYKLGDGGGGVFMVENSACATDGGICFGFDEYLSDVKTEVHSLTRLNLNLANRNIAFGTLSVDLLDTGGNLVATIDGRHLHGHLAASPQPLRDNFDYTGGVFTDARRPHNYLSNNFGGGSYRIQYQYFTNDLRLVRKNIGNTLYVDWFGARIFPDDPGFDNQPVIAQTINIAKSLNTISTIRFGKPAVYEYFGSIELYDGLTLAGSGGTELTTAEDEFGNTYSPVRIKPNHTRLRVKAGEALKHLKMIYLASTHSNYLAPDAKRIMQTRRTLIRPESGALTSSIQNIVLDGNWEKNQDALQNRDAYGGFNALETEMRNAPGWAGFIATNHGQVDIPLGQQITLRNIAVLGYGSNGLLGNANNEWSGENVLLGNSVWNHVWYNAGGTWKNLTFTGFAWTHGTPSWGSVENLVYDRGQIGPYRSSPVLINIRGPDVYDATEYSEPRSTRSDGSMIPLGFSVDGFYIDCRGGEILLPFAGIGANVTLKNGVVIEPGTAEGYLYVERANGYQKALYPNNLIENVKIFQIGPDKGHLIGSLNVTESTIRNIEVIDVNNSPHTGRTLIVSWANWRNHPAWEYPQTIFFEGIHDDSRSMTVLKTGVRENAAGRDIYIRNSRFNNRTNRVVSGPNQSGKLSEVPGDLSKLRLFLDSVELNIGIDHYWTQLELLFEIGYFRNVTAVNSGRVSEDSGIFEYLATGGENTIDIPTNLFWIPEFVELTESTGTSNLIATVEVTHPTNTSGPYKTEPSLRVRFSRQLISGEAVSLSWSAAVRPFPEE